MEDNDIKDLFKDFAPRLGDSDAFMSRIENDLKAVEVVRQTYKAKARTNRRAIAVAALVGFVAGVVSMAVMPYATAFVAGLFSAVDETVLPKFDYSFLSYMFFTFATALSAIITYRSLRNTQKA